VRRSGARICYRWAAQEHVGQFSQADVENGFRLYRANCPTCHGNNGDGVPGIDLRRGQFRRASSDADLIRLIANGIPGTAMPPHRFVSAEHPTRWRNPSSTQTAPFYQLTGQFAP